MTYTDRHHDTTASVLFWFISVYNLENSYREGHIKEMQSFQVLKIKKCKTEACLLCSGITFICMITGPGLIGLLITAP